jgi:hypothetical protein
MITMELPCLLIQGPSSDQKDFIRLLDLTKITYFEDELTTILEDNHMGYIASS